MYEVEDIAMGTKKVASNDYWAEHYGWMRWGCMKANHFNRYVARKVS